MAGVSPPSREHDVRAFFHSLSLAQRVDCLRSGAHVALPSKNTFVSIRRASVDEEEAWYPPHQRSASEPPSPKAEAGCPPRAGTAPGTAAPAGSAGQSSSPSSSGPASQPASEEEDAAPQHGAEARGIPSSVGSAEHDAGSCRPCAWNWKKAGCRKGATCRFCHRCGEGVLQKQKKERLSLQKALRVAAKGKKRITIKQHALPPGLVTAGIEEGDSSCSSNASTSCTPQPITTPI